MRPQLWTSLLQPRWAPAAGSRGHCCNYLHHAVDAYSPLACSEILTDECKEAATAFWWRAELFFADHGIMARRGLTDNGSCYRSKVFNTALGAATREWTRPYRPRTNGKVERFNRTLAAEWAYAQLYRRDDARDDTYLV